MKMLVLNDEDHEVEVDIPSKIRLFFKTPGVIDEAISEMSVPEEYQEDAEYKYKELLEKWLEYNELMKVEFDLESMTAKVVEV